MAVEGIGATSSSKAYTDMVRQNVNREIKVSQPQPQPQPKAKEMDEFVKKATPSSTATVPTEEKGMAAAEMEKENTTSKMKDAIDKVNKKIEPTKTRCEFSYHEETKRISIKVIDQKTEETIREIPPEETLDMLSKIWELAGLMVDERR